MNSELTIYNLNKSFMSQQAPLDDNELYEASKRIYNFCKQHKNNYYMLLCNDIRYYTLFNHLRGFEGQDLNDIEEEVLLCAQDIGSILSVGEEDGAIEIWVKTDDDVCVMYFFPYDRGVIQCL